ncbi:MAG TPA: PEP-CTERM sorting domain-containing protein [Verrucomicrobiae bacterium]|nr:PEP-CTERM sorting domain-containing protein [Verrucomicrobiae bacterium]
MSVIERKRVVSCAEQSIQRCSRLVLAIAAASGFAVSSRAAILVNDTWKDGTRTDPASPTYAENNGVVGTDADHDGDLESAWFSNPSANLTVPTAGDLRGTVGSGYSWWTTYFTPAATPVTLANPGDQLTVTWVFTPTGVAAANTSQGFNLAIVRTPGSRLTADGSPASEAYAGYAMFMNMGATLNNSNPFQLREWTDSSSSLLGTSGNWGANGTSNAGLANGGTSGNHGFDSGTSYTYVMTFTLLSISLGGTNLQVSASMSGDGLNGSGSESLVYTDSTPNSLTYDTFSVRPHDLTQAASQFDTSLFKVELQNIPEPATFALVGLAIAGFVVGGRRLRR